MIEVEKIETQGREESLTREPSHFFETYETFLTNLHVILRHAETIKSAVRNPAFRPQAFGVTE